jgi:hypothetical protein
MEQGAQYATGALVQHEAYEPSHKGTLVYISVDGIEKTLRKVEENGGKALNGKTPIGRFGFTAHCEDTEGNRVGMHATT